MEGKRLRIGADGGIGDRAPVDIEVEYGNIAIVATEDEDHKTEVVSIIGSVMDSGMVLGS